VRGPSDAFFKDIVKAVGGDLLARLPDIQKRQAAAKTLGETVSLAEVAAKMGLVDEDKLRELERLEAGDAPAPKTPSGSKTKTAGAKAPSASRTAEAKTPSKAKKPAARANCTVCGVVLTADQFLEWKGVCPTCTEKRAQGEEEEDDRARRPKRLPKTPSRAGPPASSNSGPLILGLACVIAGLIVVLAIVLKQHGQPEPPSPEPQPARSSPAPRVGPSRAPVVLEPSPEAVPTPAPEGPVPETDRARQSRLAKIALEAINAANAGDFTTAKKKLAKLRMEAVPKVDDAYVKEAEKEIDAIKAHAAATAEAAASVDGDGHHKPPVVDVPDDPSMNMMPSPEPKPDPGEAKARADYVAFRKRLDPLLQKLDLDGARRVLGSAPPLLGSASNQRAAASAVAQDLEDDQLVPDALDRFLTVAARGVKKTSGTEQELRLAQGSKIKGKVTDVDGQNITVAASDGERLVRVSELVLEDILSFASQGLTLESQQDYALGRGLLLYYEGDLDGARPSLGATTLPLGKHLLDRIAREGAAQAPPIARAPGKTPPVEPRRSPPPENPSEPGGSSAGSPLAPADLAAIQERVHTHVVDEGDGRIGLIYGMVDEGNAQDWDAKGCDRWEVTSTEKPGTQNKPFRDLECGISSYDDVAILHRLPMKGDVDVTVVFWVNYLNPDSSSLVFVIGADNKKKFVGALFGQQLVKSDGRKVSAATPERPDFSRFANARDCTVRIVRKGDQVTLYFNNVARGTTSASGFEGRWGFLAHNLRIGIRHVEVHGVPDLKK
jgi:hypothetical protein